MEILYKNWDDVTISVYRDILDIVNDKSMTTTEINVALLALFLGISEDDVYNMNVTEVNKLLPNIKFLDNFDFNKNFNSKKIKLNDNEFMIDTDLTKFTVAQYVDFQTFWGKNDINTYLPNILSCILIPKGKKYNDGYDIVEVATLIEQYMPITIANSILFFFVKESVSLIRAFQICLDWKMRRMKKKMKKEDLEELQNKMDIMWEAVFSGLV